MNNLSYTDIIADENYNKGYKEGQKAMIKKYENLFYASLAWFHIYESAFGVPDKDGNPEYWKLRKLLKMPE